MNIVIIGSSGFIGRYIYKELQERYSNIDITGVSSVDVDLTQPTSVSKLTEIINEDTVLIVCAAIKKQLGDSIVLLNENLKIANNLAETLVRQTIKKLIYFSSAAVYGEDIHNTRISEQTIPCARSYYGVGKISTEALLTKVLSDKKNDQIIILRAPLIYGEGDKSLGYGPTGFTYKAIKNDTITLWGNGSELREFIYVDDVAYIVGDLVNKNFSGVLNLISGTSYSFERVLNLLQENVEYPLLVQQKERSKSKVDNIYCAKKFRELFPSFQFTTLEQGLQKTIADMSKNRRLPHE